MTKGSYLTSAPGAGATTLNVKDTTDFPASGSGWIIDTTNDRDAISWTGKTATTLTGCSGVLAHNNGATIIPAVKGMVIDAPTNEMRFFGDRGDGTIAELISLGITPEGADYIIGNFGNTQAGNSHMGLWGRSNSATGVYGESVSSVGVSGASYSGYGIACGCDPVYGKAPFRITPSGSTNAPSHSALTGSFWVTQSGIVYVNSTAGGEGTTWSKVGAQ
jgi:hypothetical protein